MGALSRADGSAAVRIGGSRVVVAVFGPKPADARRGFEERAQIKATAQFAAFSGAPARPAKARPHEPLPLVPSCKPWHVTALHCQLCNNRVVAFTLCRPVLRWCRVLMCGTQRWSSF